MQAAELRQPFYRQRIVPGPQQRRRRGALPRDHRLPLLHRFADDAPVETAGKGELARTAALALIEAVLLVADEPITAHRLAKAADLPDVASARRLVRKLKEMYDRDETAFEVTEIAGGFQLLTRPDYHYWLLRLRRTGHAVKLSPAAKETLAIVAYRQPIMRADIEGIRGVQCSEILRQLMEKGLVRIAGRDETLGRPVLYGTTKKFLQVYGMKSLKDLPKVENLQPS